MDASSSQLRLLDDNVENTENGGFLYFSGEINYENAGRILDAVKELLRTEHKCLVMDLNKVSAIDSSGLRALLQARKMAENAKVEFKLASIPPDVARVIAISGFASTFGLVPVDAFSRGMDRPLPAGNTCWMIREKQCLSDPYVISLLRRLVQDALEQVHAPHDRMCDVQIAVGEALTNAYRHGSPVKGENKIALKCSVCDSAIIVEIRDEGTPFDEDAVSIPDPKLMKDHGMGIYLMRQAMDVVEFAHNCPGNRVRMLKWLD